MAFQHILRATSIVIALHGSASADPEVDPAGAPPDPSADRPADPPADPPADATVSAAKREPTGRFAIGVGVDPDDGFLAAASVSNSDLFHTGTLLSLDARLSEREQTFSMLFREPHLADTDLALDVELRSTRIEWPGFVREGAGGSLTLSHPLGRSLRGFASYRVEDVSVDGGDGGAARMLEPGADPPLAAGLLSSVRTGLLYDTRDTPVLPRRGTDAGAWIEAADHRLGSDTDLLRARAWLNHHQPLGPLTLHVGGGVESVTSRDPRGVPLSERVQLDGSSELRGFHPGDLGPTDMLGVARGGNLEATGKVELEFPLWPRAGLSGAVFADAAVLADLEGSQEGRLGASVGAGLIWRSPIGPMAIWLAKPLDERDAPAIMFSLGLGF